MWRSNGNVLTIGRRASVNWVMLIYFASGACSLIDEVVWVRLLKLTLGNTVYAASIVVSVFMAGLALGALIMSRYSDRIRRRLRLYALLETLVTISALSLPFALRLADAVYVWFYRTYHPTHAQLLIVQVIISAAILLVPSILMGSTLPLLGRFITALEAEAGHLVGKLYALNTFGAAFGCFLAGFVLIRALGVMGALYTAAGLNLLVAFGGWLLSRFSTVAVEQPVEAAAVESAEVTVARPADGRFYALVLAFFMSGLISIGYELLWMRSIVHLLSGYTYVFSAVLTVYLLGNVIGAGIGSRIVRNLKVPAVGFALTLCLLGLCGIFYLPLLILWSSKVLPYVNRGVESMGRFIPYSVYMVKPIVQSIFLFLVPTVIMGIGFPIALQAWANHMHKVGRSTGTAYGANTIGAVIGGIVTGFVLIPLLGVELSISILGLTGVWIGCIMYIMFARSLRKRLYWGLRPAVVGRCAFFGLAIILTVFVVKAPPKLFNAVVKKSSSIPPDYSLVLVKEGLTTTVSLHRDLSDDALHMYSSGQNIAGDNYIERGDQKMLGHLAVLLNSDAKRVLSVGFGSGETTACLAQHKLERIDCVEIAPEVVEVALKFFTHINLGDRLQKEVNMVFMDAKNYIHLTDSSYDMIINDSIHPRDFAENASLYTKEYFESVRAHLNKNGMIISWLPTYHMPASVFKSIVGTMMDVFPYVTMWYLTPHPAPLVLIAGSEQPQYFSPKYIDNELLKDGVGANLAAINIHNSMDVLSCYIADGNDLSKYITTFYTNSDYSPFVEFTTDSETPRDQIFRQFVMDVRSESIYDHIDWTGFSHEEREKWIADYQKLCIASTYLLLTNSTDNYLERLRHIIEGLRILPDNPALIDVRKKTEREIYLIAVKRTQAGETDEALRIASKVLDVYPKSAVAWLIRSGVMEKIGDGQRAFDAARMAVHLAPDSADAHFRLGFILFGAGQWKEAVTEYEDALRLAEKTRELTTYNQGRMLNALAMAYAADGRLDEAIAAAEKAYQFALSTGRKEMAEEIRQKLVLFRETAF